jgi:hypothetical protein
MDSGRLTEPHDCEAAPTFGGTESVIPPVRAARPPRRDPRALALEAAARVTWQADAAR